MFHEYSQILADKLIDLTVIPQEQKNVYAYGLELLVSTVAGVFSLIVVSALFELPLLWLPYLAGFIPLRLTGGGYHAKSHWQCILTFTTAYILGLILVKNVYLPPITVAILSLSALIITFTFSPVEACNKSLTTERKKRNRRRSLLLGICNLGASLLAVGLRFSHHYFVVLYFIGNAAAACSMVVAMIIKTLRRRKTL